MNIKGRREMSGKVPIFELDGEGSAVLLAILPELLEQAQSILDRGADAPLADTERVKLALQIRELIVGEKVRHGVAMLALSDVLLTLVGKAIRDEAEHRGVDNPLAKYMTPLVEN